MYAIYLWNSWTFQENKHVDQVKKIVTLKSEDNVEAVKSNSPQKPYNEVVHPINCAQGKLYI